MIFFDFKIVQIFDLIREGFPLTTSPYTFTPDVWNQRSFQCVMGVSSACQTCLTMPYQAAKNHPKKKKKNLIKIPSFVLMIVLFLFLFQGFLFLCSTETKLWRKHWVITSEALKWRKYWLHASASVLVFTPHVRLSFALLL